MGIRILRNPDELETRKIRPSNVPSSGKYTTQAIMKHILSPCSARDCRSKRGVRGPPHFGTFHVFIKGSYLASQWRPKDHYSAGDKTSDLSVWPPDGGVCWRGEER